MTRSKVPSSGIRRGFRIRVHSPLEMPLLKEIIIHMHRAVPSLYPSFRVNPFKYQYKQLEGEVLDNHSISDSLFPELSLVLVRAGYCIEIMPENNVTGRNFAKVPVSSFDGYSKFLVASGIFESSLSHTLSKEKGGLMLQ